ncbi:fasciclin domain-containing protein [Haloferula sp.]|uniref:fasciclin domain-containing protein n=1 Tax=Haloferula sp. TaxID=2497595 RepID=UPI003C77E541
MKSPILGRSRGFIAATIALAMTGAVTAMNVVEQLASKPEFSTLVTAVTEAGLVDALANAEDVTIFAPSNAAFARIAPEDLNALLADKEALTKVLTYHVSPGSTRFSKFEDGPRETLLEGSSVDVSVTSFFRGFFRRVEIDEVRITRANIPASNGIIHRIESVLDPSADVVPSILDIAAGNPDFSILTDLVKKAGYSNVFASDALELTVFAPTNAAFEALGEETLEAVSSDRRLLRSILRNHIAFGSLTSDELSSAGSVTTALRRELAISPSSDSVTGLAVDGKPINAANIIASNGIVHVVGEVLVPAEPRSLVDIASSREELATFVTAVGLAGLAETFDSTDKWPAYTIFAPNNDAFTNLPEGVLDGLLSDPTGALADVLKLHVVAGQFPASNLYDGQILRSLSGQRLKVSVADDGIRINNALVAEPDLRAENGFLHIMQDVIAPGTFTVAHYVRTQPYLSTLSAALDAANLTGALDNPEADLTLFAPINFAFRKLPAGTVDALLEDPEGQLTQILLYHVLGESLSASELIDRGTAQTLQSADVKITSRSFRFWGWRIPFSIVQVNGERVIAADIETDNGTVHLISGVLIPPTED